jgi:hypothetical protein
MTGPRWCQVLAPAVVLLGMSAAVAQAPLKPWPDQASQQQQPQRAWPGGEGAQQAAAPPAAAPMAPIAAPPQMMGPMGPMGAPRQQGAPAENPCLKEFIRLRGEVEKKGALAKAVNDRKGSREEMCAAISGIHAAQVTWVKYAAGEGSKCGIPPDIVKQLRGGQDHLGKLRKNVCAAGPATAGAPAAPSLSEALGTAQLPPSTGTEGARKRGGVLDTMTGTPIR